VSKYWNELLFSEFYRRSNHTSYDEQYIKNLRHVFQNPPLSSKLMPKFLLRDIEINYLDIFKDTSTRDLLYKWGHAIKYLTLHYPLSKTIYDETLKEMWNMKENYPLSLMIHPFLASACPNILGLNVSAQLRNNEYYLNYFQDGAQIASIVRKLPHLEMLTLTGSSPMFDEFFEDLKKDPYIGIGKKLKFFSELARDDESFQNSLQLKLRFHGNCFPK
jgi:hypothetical protein